MADDLQNLGGVQIFPFYINWAMEPSTQIALPRKIIAYPGTAQTMVGYIEETPITWDAQINVFNKEDEYTLLDFFNSVRGRNLRFWIQHPKSAFDLVDPPGAGATTYVCAPNAAEDIWLGQERVYLLLKNGDLITRHITAANYNEATDKLSLEFTTPTDRAITLDDYWRMGRFLLCRLDEDELEVEHFNDNSSQVKLRFYELVKEYSAI